MSGMDDAERFKQWLSDEIGAEVIVIMRDAQGEWHESSYSFESCWETFWESIS